MNGYPAGAFEDPDAPFNQIDRGNCPACNGTCLKKDEKFCKEEQEQGNCMAGSSCSLCTEACDECDGTGEMTAEQERDARESWFEDTNER